MPLRSLFSSHHQSHFLTPEMRGFFVSQMFSQLGQALLFVAGPIYVYTTLGKLPLWNFLPFSDASRQFIVVLLYFGGTRLVSLILTPLLARWIGRTGLSLSGVVGLLLHVAVNLGTIAIPLYPALFIPVILVRGAMLFITNVTHSVIFATEIKMKEVGKEVGSYAFLRGMCQATAPLLGALLAVHLSPSAPYIIAMVFMTLAAFALLWLPNFRTETVWSWKVFFEWHKEKRWQKTTVGLAGYNWESIGLTIFWPIFLYTVFGKIEPVGYIIASSTILALFTSYLSGWSIDHHAVTPRMQKLTGFTVGAFWISRTLFSHLPFVLVLTDAVDKIVYGAFSTLYQSRLIQAVQKKNFFLFAIHQEVFFSALVVLVSFALIPFLYLNWHWTPLFMSFLIGNIVSVLLLQNHE